MIVRHQHTDRPLVSVVVVNMSAMPNTESMNNTRIEMTNAEPASFPALFLKAFIEYSPSMFGRKTVSFLIRRLSNLSYLTIP